MEKQPAQSIEQLIIATLQKGTLSTVKLIADISTIRPDTTKQGVYRVLRKLKEEEKIVIHGKSVSLNLLWVKKRQEFFSLAQFYYSPQGVGAGDFLHLQEKDKIIYTFKNLKLLDIFASHILHMFNEVLNPELPIFVYNPHEWFAYARQESEDTVIQVMQDKKRQILITVTHSDPLDKALKRKFASDLLQYNVANKQIFEKSNYYLNIIGDYLIEVLIDPKIARRIDEFFKKTVAFDEIAREKLARIIAKSGKNKLTISRHKNKAEKYRHLLAKNFYIKK